MLPVVPSQAPNQIKALFAANLDQAISSADPSLTNHAVAQKIGSTESQVWRWRRGRHMPSLETIAALADLFFDGDISQFYVEPDEKQVA
jgi:transcriptional regulator with XRE-family HTH domain